VGDLKFLILHYKAILSEFKHQPLKAPVIVLIDNDTGTNEIFGVVKANTAHKTISTETKDSFYRIHANLYLVKTPETGKSKGMTCVESFFDASLLAIKIDGLVFDPDKKHNEPGKYGNAIFAEKVVRPNKGRSCLTGRSAAYAHLRRHRRLCRQPDLSLTSSWRSRRTILRRSTATWTSNGSPPERSCLEADLSNVRLGVRSRQRGSNA
jgi:hypothetical protein